MDLGFHSNVFCEGLGCFFVGMEYHYVRRITVTSKFDEGGVVGVVG